MSKLCRNPHPVGFGTAYCLKKKGHVGKHQNKYVVVYWSRRASTKKKKEG